VYLDDPAGTVLPGPTNLAFGGADLDRLYVVNFSGWAIREIDADVPGQPLFTPEIP
jgi:sugar lactone lactonase YvrE